jgi:hypothetical protein
VRHSSRPCKTATWICGGSKIHPDLPIRTGAVPLPGQLASDARVLLLRRDASLVYIVCGIKGRDFREQGWQEVSKRVIKICLKRRLVTCNSVFDMDMSYTRVLHIKVAYRVPHKWRHAFYVTRPLLCARIMCYATVITHGRCYARA